MKSMTRRPLARSFPKLPFLSLQLLESRDVPTAFWVDDNWAAFTPGQPITDVDPVTPGDQPGTFGTDSFGKVSDALALAIGGGDIVTVNAGDYSTDAANLFTSGVSLRFQEALSKVGSIAASAGDIILDVPVSMGHDNTSTSISVIVSGTGTLIKSGTGTLTLETATNTYSGGTVVSSGTLVGKATTGALGKFLSFGLVSPTTNKITLGDADTANNDVALILEPGNTGGMLIQSIVVAANPGGTGKVTIGSPNVVQASATWIGGNAAQGGTTSNSITLNRDITFQCGIAGQIRVNSKISGTGNITIDAISAAGTQRTVILYRDPTGIPANNFTGNFTVTDDAILQQGVGTNQLNQYIPDATNISLSNNLSRYIISGGSANGSQNETVGAINGGVGSAIRRTTSTSTSFLTIGSGNANGDFSGFIEQSTTGPPKLAIIKEGTGTQIFRGGTTTNAGNIAYSEGTTINNGTIILGNATGSALGTGAVIVNANGTLGSVNVVNGPANAGAFTGALTLNGRLAPGDIGDTGQLKTGAITMASTGTFHVNLQGLTPGVGPGGYDQTVVTGTVALGNAKLVVDTTGFTGIVGDKFTILDNDGADTITTTFSGAPDQSTLLSQDGNFTFKIYYNGGDGNDIVLERVAQATVRYVDDAWAAFTDGTPITDVDPVAAGDQPGTVGTNAFGAIAKAVAASAINDKIVVNSGTYPEAVVLNTTLAVTFQEADSSILSLAGMAASTSVTLASIVLMTGGDNASTEFAGSIGGTGSLIKIGAGTFTLSGISSYTGATTLADGAIKSGIAGAFSDDSAFAITAPSRLILNGFSNVIANLAGDGIVENASATNAALTAGGNGQPLTFTGTLQDGVGGGTFGFIKVGAGALSLPDAMTFTGPFGLQGGSYSVAKLVDGGSASPFGASSNAAANLTIGGGAKLIYTGTTDAGTDRNLTWAAGGGTIDVTDAAVTVTMSGTLTGSTPGNFVKAGPGTLSFTATNAFQEPTGATYGANATSDMSVTGGQLRLVNLRTNGTGSAVTRGGGRRVLSISAGASVLSTGTMFVDPSNAYFSQIAGPGALILRNATASKTNPTMAFDVGPNGGNGVPFGLVISAPVDFGNVPAVITGKANRNDVGRYSGDLRFNGAWTGTANVEFIGLSNLNNGGTNAAPAHNVHFVLNNSNAAFTGGVSIANSDLELTTATALSAANSVTFNNFDDLVNTQNRGTLFLWGRNVTIGSLNDTSAAGTTSSIRNGSLDTTNGGTNTTGATGSVALGVNADSKLTIVQSVNGTFNGAFNDGGNDTGEGAPGTYRKLSVVKEGPASLTATAFNNLTGTVAVNEGALLVNNFTAFSSGISVAAAGTLGGDGGTLPALPNIAGTITGGAVGKAGQLFTGDLSFAFDGVVLADLLGDTVGTGYDRVTVTGAVDLTGAKLSVTSAFSPVNGTQFIIIDNDGFDLVDDTFQGLPQDSFFNAGGTKYQIKYDGGDGNDVVLTASGTGGGAVVSNFTVNGGAAQRSRLTTITINFASPVDASTFQGLGAITLTRTASTPNGINGTIVQTGATGANGRILVSPASGNVSSLTLTFDNADGSNETSGVEYGSLADGRWQLAVPSAGFTSTLGDTNLRRLFGDFEGVPGSNGTVDGNDFATFGAGFGSSGAPGFNPFDYDNNGTIDSVDLGAVGARFGFSV